MRNRLLVGQLVPFHARNSDPELFSAVATIFSNNVRLYISPERSRGRNPNGTHIKLLLRDDDDDDDHIISMIPA